MIYLFQYLVLVQAMGTRPAPTAANDGTSSSSLCCVAKASETQMPQVRPGTVLLLFILIVDVIPLTIFHLQRRSIISVLHDLL